MIDLKKRKRNKGFNIFLSWAFLLEKL